MIDLPAQLELTPPERLPEHWCVTVPGSKSLTNRALIIAALANGRSTLSGALDSEDTRVMVEALRTLGFAVDHDAAAATIRVEGRGGVIPKDQAEIFVANSGTSLRFLTSLVSLGYGTYRLDGVERMRERPVNDLLLALNRLGTQARSELGTGCPPVIVGADGLDGGYTDVAGNMSSQFLSGLLMVAPYARQETSIEVIGTLVSQPYISMTLAVMQHFGVTISQKGFKRFHIKPQKYVPCDYAIEPDASAASYWFALAAIAKSSVTVQGLGTTSIQGDLAFLDVLEHMGCRVERGKNATTVTGGSLRGIDIDMNAISDTVMTLAAVALFANGITRIRNVAHIRHKETDRIAALAVELRKLGARVEELDDGLLINPPETITPACVETYQDHRMAMSFALASAKSHITIDNPACVAKTYPMFWNEMAAWRGTELSATGVELGGPDGE